MPPLRGWDLVGFLFRRRSRNLVLEPARDFPLSSDP